MANGNWWEDSPLAEQSDNWWDQAPIYKKKQQPPRQFDPSRFLPKATAPAVTKKPQDNIFRQALDIPVNIGRGGVQGIKMMTDIMGADNPVSKALSGVEGYMADLLSAQAKDDQEEIARILKDAEDKGFGEQLMAGVKAFSIAPVDIMSQAMGTMIPVVATGLAGSAAKLGAVGIRAVQTGVGAGMGAGMTKGNIYSEVKQELVNSGIGEQEAEKAAVEAQSYGGKNLDQILFGAGLGAASTLGAESILTRILTKQGKEATAGAVTRALKGGITEALPEAAQAAQEQLATNVALQREGMDVPTMRGVVSAAAMEGIAGAAIGAPVGALERSVPLKPKTPAEENLEQATDIARKVAESGAPLTASMLQDQAAENVRQEELAKQLAEELEVEERPMVPIQEEKEPYTPPGKEEFRKAFAEQTPESLAATEAGFQANLANEDAEARAFAQTGLEALQEFRQAQAPTPETEAIVEPPVETPLTTAVTEQIVLTQPTPTDATQEILQQESLRAEPQDRVEIGETEGAIPSDSIPTPEGSESQGKVINDLQSVADNTATREQITALSEAGLVDIIKGQPVINEDGEAILAQAQAPLPALTPEERVAEIEGEPAAEAPAIVEQAPVVSEEGALVSEVTPEPTISEIPQTSEMIGAEPDELSLQPRNLAEERRKELQAAVSAAEAGPQKQIDPHPGLTFNEIINQRLPLFAPRAKGRVKNLPKGYVKQGDLYIFKSGVTGQPVGAGIPPAEAAKATAPAPSLAEPSRAVTTAPETAAEPAVVPERDVTNREQMTPEEASVQRRSNEKNIVLEDDAGNYISKTSKGYEVYRLEATSPKRVATFGSQPQYLERAKQRLAELSKESHSKQVELAAINNRPVSASAIDTYGITLPEGYAKQGDLYVYQPAAPTAPTPEAAPAPEAPAEIAVGSRIKLGRSPQTYTIQEAIPQTATEQELGEQYYSVQNERTGEVQVVEKNDMKLVKGKGALRMAAEGRAEKVTPVPESDRYGFEESVIEANKVFGGEIPPNFAIITDPTNKEFEFKAEYDPNNGMVVVNLAYIRKGENLQDIISHELGHYLYGDPDLKSAFEEFWNAMTPEQQAFGNEIIRSHYNQNTGQIQIEEKQVRAFMSLIEEANAQPQWRKLVDAIKRLLNRVFGTEFQTTDRGALAVLAAGVKRFGSGEQIIRAEPQDALRMAADTDAQRQEQLFGNKSVGDILDTPAGFFKTTDDIIRKDYFDAGTVSSENTERAFNLLEALTDPQDGANYAKSIVADVAAKMPEVENATLKSVAVVRIQNELFRYAVKLAIKGDQSLRKQIYLRANKMPTGVDETVSQAGRTLSARQRILDPTIAALDMIQASDVEQAAAVVFGTNSPTKEQTQVVKDALTETENTKMDNEGEILDGLTAVETRANVNLTKKIDEKIKKAGKKKKKVRDIVDSTEAGKEEFSQLDEEAAAAAIKQKAQVAISRKADNIIESLAKLQSDVYVWPQSKTNDIRTIVQQDLRQRPDMGRKEPWMNMLTGKLTQAGVSDSQAQTIAELVWRQHEINSMNREIAEMQKAAEFGSLGGIIQRIKDTPLIQQQGPDWREGVIRDYLREAGLSANAAETAARLYNSIIIDRLAKAQQKAFEDTLNKSAPWKDYFARNARLAKGALEKIRLAVRTGALDPSRNLENVIAEQNGWTGFTDKQFQRLAELDEIISDPNVDDVTRTEGIVEINKIVSDAKLPVRLRDGLAAYYTGQALMGIPTALVNIASPVGFSLRNLFTDMAKYSVTSPSNIPLAFEGFMESMRSWYDQVSYAFKNQIYRNDVVEYLAGNNTLRELFNKGKKQWSQGKYAEGFVNMAVGMAQITGRVLSSLDQGAISALEGQNINRYTMEAMKMAKIPKDKQKFVANKILEARRKTKAQLVSEGMPAERAGVLADLEVRSLVMAELSELGIPFVNVLESSINEALQAVGRNRVLNIKGLDEEQKTIRDEGLISYPPIAMLELIAQGAATKGPAMQIFSRMLYGFALVPARVFHNAAWYSPYGLVRIGIEAAGKKTGLWSPRYAASLGNELQYRQRLTDAIAGSIVMLGLASLMSSSVDDEDEDKAFRIVITGNGPDAATDRQFHDSWNKKWKPYSIHIVVNGTIIPINIGRSGEAIFFPIMLASALDDWQIKGKLNQTRKSPEELNMAVEMAGSAFFALAQRGPFAAFTKPLFDASKEGRVTEELIGNLGFFGKTFIPGIGASFTRNISDFINDPVDRSSAMGAIYANTPMVGPMMGTKALNALGQPMRVDDWGDRLFRLGVPLVFSFPKNTPENELNELILKQGSGPSFPTRRVAQAAVGRPLDDKEFEAYVREYGRVMSDKMFKNRKRLENMPTAQYDKELQRYAQGFSIDGIPISGARDSAVRAVNRMAQ